MPRISATLPQTKARAKREKNSPVTLFSSNRHEIVTNGVHKGIIPKLKKGQSNGRRNFYHSCSCCYSTEYDVGV